MPHRQESDICLASLDTRQLGWSHLQHRNPAFVFLESHRSSKPLSPMADTMSTLPDREITNHNIVCSSGLCDIIIIIII